MRPVPPADQETALGAADTREAGRLSRTLITLRTLSDFGTFLNLVVIVAFVTNLAVGPVGIGILLAGRVFGGLLASATSRWYFGALGVRPALALLGVLRALALGVTLLVPDDAAYVAAVAAIFVLGWCSSLQATGINLRLPMWVPSQRLAALNGWIASSAALGAVAGSFVAGVLVASLGSRWAMAVNAVVFLVVAVFASRVPDGSPYRAPVSEGVTRRDRLRAAVAGEPLLTVLMLVALFDTLGSAAHNVGFPILGEVLSPGSGEFAFGVILACWAAGKFAGSQLAGRVVAKLPPSRVETVYLVAVAGMSMSFIATFWSPTLAVALALVGCAGLCDGWAEVALVTRLQLLSEHTRLGFLNAFTFMHMTGFGIGMLVVAPFFEVWSHSVVVSLFHGLPLIAVAVAAGLVRTRRRAPDTGPSTRPA